MVEIDVTHGGGEEYDVVVRESEGESRHRVTMPAAELERYGGDASAEELLHASFRFLLEREPKEAILSRFELSVIESYFPEYPEEIARRLDG